MSGWLKRSWDLKLDLRKWDEGCMALTWPSCTSYTRRKRRIVYCVFSFGTRRAGLVGRYGDLTAAIIPFRALHTIHSVLCQWTDDRTGPGRCCLSYGSLSAVWPIRRQERVDGFIAVDAAVKWRGSEIKHVSRLWVWFGHRLICAVLIPAVCTYQSSQSGG